ncbi:ABC transporter ATP-binding protein [Rhabdothermincola sp.]|uniref:ABC transporter ATP-binding protein n=1 Tax=Rhabdothermincola sp. TaxID=2820405 RepID=UPI002FE28086
MTAAIETVELTRGFASGLAVDRVTFSVERGEVLALLGPNGAGKTTTVRLLNGVLRPDRGTARVLGFDAAREGEAVRRRTGVLTENAGLDDRLTTRENLEFTARIRGFSTADARRRVDELLERFGMAERAGDLTQGFSTGQRKRIALARALLHDPEVLFLDEPTSGLDPAGTRDVIDLIHELASEGRTIVLATHFLGEAGRLAHRMAVLHNGRLRAFGSPQEIAAGIWQDMAADLDLGGPAPERTLRALRAIDGVTRATASPTGAELRVTSRDALAAAVAALVAHEVQVFGAVAHPPTLEDVYFEVERRILAETGDASFSDGFLRRRLQDTENQR